MKSGNICEVSQKFTIVIEREQNINIPLNFTLYKDENCTEIISTDENGNYSSEDFKLTAGIDETKTYYLKVRWPEKENNTELSWEIGYLKINVLVEQID